MNKALLHRIIAKQGKTNEDVAKMLGISRQSYQARLNGSVAFSNVEISKIQKYLGFGEEDLLNIFFSK